MAGFFLRHTANRLMWNRALGSFSLSFLVVEPIRNDQVTEGAHRARRPLWSQRMANLPEEIARLAREIDHTGDYTHSPSQIAELINEYGRSEYRRGELTEIRNPRACTEWNG